MLKSKISCLSQETFCSMLEFYAEFSNEGEIYVVSLLKKSSVCFVWDVRNIVFNDVVIHRLVDIAGFG